MRWEAALLLPTEAGTVPSGFRPVTSLSIWKKGSQENLFSFLHQSHVEKIFCFMCACLKLNVIFLDNYSKNQWFELLTKITVKGPLTYLFQPYVKHVITV